MITTKEDPRAYRFRVGRGTLVAEQLMEVVENADPVPLNISAATLEVHFRAYRAPSSACLADVVLTKGTAASGFVSGYIPAFTTPYTSLTMEIVLVDTSVNDAATKSTKAEYLVAEWVSPVVDASRT